MSSWVASYSAATQTTVVTIPVATIKLTVERIPQIRAKMYVVLLRRMARYYWTSLATNGSPTHRVAGPLISRLALNGQDYGREREIAVRQRDIVRLTVMSRSAVAGRIAQLASCDLIHLGNRSDRCTGLVRVPNVKRLKDNALSEVRGRQIRPLIR